MKEFLQNMIFSKAWSSIILIYIFIRKGIF